MCERRAASTFFSRNAGAISAQDALKALGDPKDG